MQEKSKGLLGVVVIAIVLIVGYFALSGGTETVVDTDTSVGEGDTITIGYLGPLSGDAFAYGEPLSNVSLLAVEEINAAGGVNGAMLELVLEDGECDGTSGANAMQKLVNVDKVEVVLGGLCSSESLAAGPIAADAEVLLFSAASSSPDLTTDGGEYFFRNYPSDAFQATVTADVAYNDYEYRSVATIYESTDYALALNDAFAAAFEGYGGTVVSEGFAPETEDFRTTLAKLQAEEVDALYISTQTPASSERILQQIQELGWEVPLMAGDVLTTSDLPAEYPELTEGLIGAVFSYDEETTADLAAAYEDRFGMAPEFMNYVQTQYDAVYMLADALAEVGNDGAALREWFEEVEGWEGLSGTVEFDENGDRSVGGHSPVIVEGGEVVPYEG